MNPETIIAELRRERSEARAEVAQLKGALALGQENCDSEYEALRRERDTARDGLRDGHIRTEQLEARVKELEVSETELIQERDEAEKVADKLTSLVLGEPIDWAFHDAKWAEAIEQAAALRARVAELEALLASEKATRNAIIAKGQAVEQRNAELVATLEAIANGDDAPGIDAVGEWAFGLHCGIEDRMITDRYEAADYGHAIGAEKVTAWATGVARAALDRVESGTPDHIPDAAQMVPPAKHPDDEAKVAAYLLNQAEAERAIDAARKEVQP